MQKKIITFLDTGCCGLKPLALMIVSLVFSGFLLFFVGFILVLVSSFHIPPKIDKYNTAVENWNNKYMNLFDGNDISVNITSKREKSFIDLVPGYVDVTNKGYPELHTYNDLTYKRTIDFFQHMYEPNFQIDFSLVAAKRTKKGNPTQLYPNLKIDLWLLAPIGKYSELECEKNVHGFIVNGTCSWLYKLSELCAKVGVLDEGGGRRAFFMSDKYGGYGCRPNIKDLKDLVPRWSVADYSIVPRVGNETLRMVLQEFSIKTTVKSENDPYILALNITGGQFRSFYDTTSNTMNKIRVVGLIVLVAGFVLMGFFFIMLVCCCLCKKTRKRLVTIGLTEEQQLIYKYKEEEAQYKFVAQYSEEAKKLKREHMKSHLFPDERQKTETDIDYESFGGD